MALLQENTPHQLDVLSDAMALILRDGSAVPKEFKDALIRNVDGASDDETKGFWLAALLCLDAEAAIGRFETWVGETSAPTDGERRVSLVLNHIWGDRFHGFNSEHQSFQSPNILLRLIKLTHSHVRAEDDIEHSEVYSPGIRDHAQTARGLLLNVLCKIAGCETYQALIELSRFHPAGFAHDRMLVLAEERAEADCEDAPWEPHYISEFAADAEHEPRSQYDLHLIALSRLDDLKLDLEDGDESEASLLQKVADEVELRRIIANRLKQASSGKYTTGSEEELADQKRTDIRLHNPAVEARIPIELKIAERWSAGKLRERLENQLIKQYLRKSRYGTFLLVRRGNKVQKDKSTWSKRDSRGRHKLSFAELVTWLEKEAIQLARENPNVDGLAVMAIDLTVRRKKKSDDI